MSLVTKIPKDYKVTKIAFGTSAETSFSPFEIVDMGKKKVVVNKGVITIGSKFYNFDSDKYIGEIKPQDVLAGKIKESAFLTVAKNDYVCLIVSKISEDSPSFEIKAIKSSEVESKENSISDGKLFKLAKIIDEKTQGDFVYLQIETYFKNDLTISSVGGATQYIPWKPFFYTTGPSTSPTYKCKFNLGTVNNVAAEDWDKEFTLPSDDSVRFVVLTINSANGKVSSISISLENDPLAEDVVLIDTPPPQHKILLGVVDKTSGRMIENTNLNAYGMVVYMESKTTGDVGREPFSKYWRWAHSKI